MNGDAILRLRKQVGGPRDGALLRFSLANALLADAQAAEAAIELRRALEFDPLYSAAWKLFARSLAEAGDPNAAIEAYERGIEVATARGDKQAASEMKVFLRRLVKAGSNG